MKCSSVIRLLTRQYLSFIQPDIPCLYYITWSHINHLLCSIWSIANNNFTFLYWIYFVTVIFISLINLTLIFNLPINLVTVWLILSLYHQFHSHPTHPPSKAQRPVLYTLAYEQYEAINYKSRYLTDSSAQIVALHLRIAKYTASSSQYYELLKRIA